MNQNRIEITSNSVEATRSIGEMMGRIISAPVVILLYGDLGSGKTAFVQGLAKGLAVSEQYYITSPTYTLINEYPGRIPIYHVDLYRLKGPEDFEEIGFTDMLSQESHVTAVEWADRLAEDLPEKHIRVSFRIINPDIRRILISSGGSSAEDLIQRIRKGMKEKKWL